MPVDITTDIIGSEGAAFTGPVDSKQLRKVQRVDAFGKAEVAQLRLFGDWQLKIRFTYNIVNIQEERAMKVKLPPTKEAAFRAANEEGRILADKINEGGHFDKFSADVVQAK